MLRNGKRIGIGTSILASIMLLTADIHQEVKVTIRVTLPHIVVGAACLTTTRMTSLIKAMSCRDNCTHFLVLVVRTKILI